MNPERPDRPDLELGETLMRMIATRAIKFAQVRNKAGLLRMRNLARYVYDLMLSSDLRRLTYDTPRKDEAARAEQDKRPLRGKLH
jgi:hypothetical protein